jgi:hypothetical protein
LHIAEIIIAEIEVVDYRVIAVSGIINTNIIPRMKIVLLAIIVDTAHTYLIIDFTAALV